MKLHWQIDETDVQRTKSLVDKHKDNWFVKQRATRNLNADKPKTGKADVWQQLVGCLLSTQQKSGPNRPVGRFISTIPFPLSYELCCNHNDLRAFSHELLTGFGGIRFTTKLPNWLAANLSKLENGLWSTLLDRLENLRLNQHKETERASADYVDEELTGFGPKQSRNLLQCLGLTRFEIPLDSRFADWLNDFGFPIWFAKNTKDLLSNRDFYCLVLDGIQALCNASDVPPCILDAAVFVDRSKFHWTQPIPGFF
jgi:hypothetical protein